MHISSAFDSGNVEVVSDQDPANFQLKIEPDAGKDHFQWFHFRLSGARGQSVAMHLLNASQASYPKGWEGYRVCASYDRQRWFRLPTTYNGATLTIEHTPEQDAVYYAYFAPYSLERHADLIARAQGHDGVSVQRLGATIDGRDLDCVRLLGAGGGPAGLRKKCWIIARQHPGESMAEWLVEGLLDRLLDENDAIGRALRARADFFVVPNMNPDGSFRGHLRNNAVGANLNRQWERPSVEHSPEVFWVQNAMREQGVDFFLDVHGDEALPYNFMAGAEGIVGWDAQSVARQASYLSALQAASPDFQTRHGYPVTPPGKANLALATNWVAHTFGCLSMTLEQPFKDTADTPHAEGWSPERAKRLGAAQLSALWASFPAL